MRREEAMEGGLRMGRMVDYRLRGVFAVPAMQMLAV